MNRESITSLLEAEGLFSSKLPGFEVREGQTAMLRDVMAAYDEEAIALIEAGTGTGKSLAYLIPALYWALEKGEPTVVATHTIALQEQLIEKDIPFLLDTLDLDLKVVLVKGMQNYVCLRKLHDAAHELPDSLLSWSKTTQEGSRSALPVLPSPDLWEQIGAEKEGCTHVKCPHYKECFYFKARKEAADAHLIIANHHLLFADLSLREQSDNYGEMCVLPAYKRLVLDEAHHVEDVATEYFADKVSRRGLVYLLGRLISDRSTGKLMALHKKLFEVYPEDGGERALLNLLELTLPAEKRALIDQIQTTFERINQFAAEHQSEEKFRFREEHVQHPFWVEKVQPAVQECVDLGKEFVQSVLLLEVHVKRDANLPSKCEGILADIGGICRRLGSAFDILHHFVFSPLEPTRVRWIEGDGHLITADLEIATRLSETLFSRLPTTVLCSATLSTNRSFAFIRARLGIEEAAERIYESPFDYNEQALMTVPVNLPDPGSPHFVQAAAEHIYEVIQISQGGVFVLFTSYHMLKSCEQILLDRLLREQFTLFCQGDEGRTALLTQFRQTPRAVLFGTDSFWEGVDVVGEALRCVVLVKLPFKVPSDPLFQARSEAIAQQGGSPFFDYSLPHAIVKFKQGFGRLIRNKADRGCVVCLDTRLAKKGYGKHFLKSLPNCPVVFAGREEVFQSMRARYPSFQSKN
ncbi:MAG: putative ATP-dependent DNA helicase YoaA [Chlamydiales bacterium]|nr:putative ATP-dependent DNA helicase YoaA [Chlamydiales bacterium]